jgi:hypothetical protein
MDMFIVQDLEGMGENLFFPTDGEILLFEVGDNKNNHSGERDIENSL